MATFLGFGKRERAPAQRDESHSQNSANDSNYQYQRNGNDLYDGDSENYHGNGELKYDELEEQSREGYENNGYNAYDGDQPTYEIASVQLFAGDSERAGIVQSFGEMRRESLFCDVAFLCQGVVIRAHKVVVSSWSRWLRSLLMATSTPSNSNLDSDSTVSMDIFMPANFAAVIDYMYGRPLIFSLPLAEETLKVIRRLEMLELEKQCWRFLISIIDTSNCETLHQLADRFDCPPLKLASFRVLQERDPAYTLPPAHLEAGKRVSAQARAKALASASAGTGLTGPGESSFFANIASQNVATGSHVAAASATADGGALPPPNTPLPLSYDDVDDDEDDEPRPSLLSFTENTDNRFGYDDWDQASQRSGQSGQNVAASTRHGHPSEIAVTAAAAGQQGARAREVVTAWQHWLQQIYLECAGTSSLAAAWELEAPQQSQFTAGTAMYDYDLRDNNNINSRQQMSQSRGRPQQQQSSSSMMMLPVAPKQQLVDIYSSSGPVTVDWKAELRRFYLAIKLPEKIASIDDIVGNWKGQEYQMISSLMMKYKKVIPPNLMDHLNDLLSFCETQSQTDR